MIPPLLAVVSLWVSAAHAVAAPLPEEPQRVEVSGYSQQFGVSISIAEEHLATQARGAGIVELLRAVEGKEFAGVWFDNAAGEFVVSKTNAVSAKTLSSALAGAGLGDDFRIAPAQYSWTELEAGQAHLNADLESFFSDHLVQTFLDARTNAAVVRMAEGASAGERSAIQARTGLQGAKAEVRLVDKGELGAARLSCQMSTRLCSRPLRGGVGIIRGEGIGPVCTAAFKAIGNVYGNRFMLTAGHCIEGLGQNWKAEAFGYTPIIQKIGPVEQKNFPPGDWAKINANGSYWDQAPSWPSMVAWWGVGEEYSIEAEAASYMGQNVCHAGLTTASSCGPVVALNLYGENNGEEHMTAFGPICAAEGDSGGPVFSQHVALGIFSGKIEPSGKCGEQYGLYTEITEADDDLGVTVGPRAGSPPFAKTYEPDVESLPSEVIFGGVVNPHLITSNYHFDYGTTTAYGSSTLPYAAGSGWGDVVVEIPRAGLKGLTTYHCRLVAQNAAGTSYGGDVEFTTPDWRPKITNVSATPEKLAATLKGTVDGQAQDAHYHFEYGPTASYGTSVPVPDGDAGTSAKAVERKVEGLEGTYHYRLVASNVEGTSASSDTTVFVQPRPSVTTQPPAEVTPTGGKFAALVNPMGVATTYVFEYGLTSSYGSKTSTASAGSGNTAVAVTAAISGLEFGTTYHYRVVVENSAGTRIGPDQTFVPGWTQQTIPHAEGTGVKTQLSGIACPSATSCIAGGSWKNSSGTTTPIIDRWNGVSWATENVPKITGEGATSIGPVACAGSAYCMAGGSFQTPSTYTPITEFWNGSTWASQKLPVPAENVNTVPNAIACPASSACMAVGHKTISGPYNAQPYVARWNGTTWTESSVAKPQGSNESEFLGLSCVTSSDCWAVGYYGLEWVYKGLAEHWNGTSWSEQTLPAPAGAINPSVGSVSCPTTNFCVAVGGYQTSAGKHASFAARWNGTSWQAEVLPELGGTSSYVTSVSCAAAGACEAIGGGGYQGGPTFAERLESGVWTVQATPAPSGWTWENGAIKAISCAAEKECMSVGTVADVPFAQRYSSGSP